ncbi:MAG: hypothetical protein IJ848_01545 [Alphaproteobacteria bacterium]|nr:hypothetical protein [Alphaproteobacteria bacterium]
MKLNKILTFIASVVVLNSTVYSMRQGNEQLTIGSHFKQNMSLEETSNYLVHVGYDFMNNAVNNIINNNTNDNNTQWHYSLGALTTYVANHSKLISDCKNEIAECRRKLKDQKSKISKYEEIIDEQQKEIKHQGKKLHKQQDDIKYYAEKLKNQDKKINDWKYKISKRERSREKEQDSSYSQDTVKLHSNYSSRFSNRNKYYYNFKKK